MSNQQAKIAKNKDLVPKRKAASVIWNYFGYKKDDIDKMRLLCLQFFTSVATARGNTTNLFDHLCRCNTTESCMGLILQTCTRPYLHPTRFPTVAQITLRTDPL